MLFNVSDPFHVWIGACGLLRLTLILRKTDLFARSARVGKLESWRAKLVVTGLYIYIFTYIYLYIIYTYIQYIHTYVYIYIYIYIMCLVLQDCMLGNSDFV